MTVTVAIQDDTQWVRGGKKPDRVNALRPQTSSAW
jgi:hypothetical protein